MSKKSEREAEKLRAIEKLRELVPPGSTVYTVLRHVSRSGMQRVISLRVIDRTTCEPVYLDGWVSDALGIRRNDRRSGLVVGGCGMDMGFHLVYELGATLHGAFYNGTGWRCVGESCPSPEHHGRHGDGWPESKEWISGPPKDGTTTHKDGGYSLRHEWI